ncbi:MAG: ATP-dependent protease ATPase subunit HslU [Candidatus Hydrogenedentes bacterium]|nr:ATP-dependent protease ATPase subunit HslU [Candidatus Hydrogenedentota bacterium]
MSALTPREIVEALDRHIVGQQEAKKKVAIALRNRWRRKQLPEGMRDEVAPKNIIMIGPTGVGKTEIARRLSKLADAPFIKVEASKFTEVGYVGRDCESMIRELTEVGVKLVKEEMQRDVEEAAKARAEQKLLDLLLPPQPSGPQKIFRPSDPYSGDEGPARNVESDPETRTREILLKKLRAGEMDQREVEISVKENTAGPMLQMFGASGMEEMGANLQEMMGRMMPQKSKRKKVSVAEARRILEQEAALDLIDMESVTALAVDRVENAGIIFLDEIDKIAGRGRQGSGPDVSREGVQRDILPIVEGSTVMTKYGPVRTDHILFIAAGAFHISKVSDLIPELQGRFPIRVELDNLGAADFARILREPECSLIKQYQSMMATEGVTLEFEEEAIDAVAEFCQRVNDETENIGARRLHTLLENLLEEISFTAPERPGDVLRVDAAMVRERLTLKVENHDLSRYIL